jgi:PAT family beta-lactamase induction signal transducer AmpG
VTGPDAPRGAGALTSLAAALRSRRTAFVVLQSFASGLPLGLVWYSIPDWLRDSGVDIRVVGLVTLAQAPWAFKVLWAPLMDRYVPPFWGRRRGWMAVTQIALLGLGLLLAGVGDDPEAVWVIGALALAIAVASASQDIAIDAYAVEVLHRNEQGVASGARIAMYRVALLVSGGVAISLAARLGWPVVNALLALLFLPILFVTWRSPEPEIQPAPPPSMRDAVWLPFLSFLTRRQALEILAFVVLYKLGDNLAQALTLPFLIDMGYSADHRSLSRAVSVFMIVGGSVIGGWVTTLAGLGHALWIFGLLQLFSNAGYLWLSLLDAPDLPTMYAATGFEQLTTGMGTGAFAVLLLRLTERQFSATQYALFSSLFALPRVVAGPITGFAVAAGGWPVFYVATMVVGVPGLVMLARFVPPGMREPDLHAGAAPAAALPPATRPELAPRALLFGTLVTAGALLLLATLDALDVMQSAPGTAFDLGAAVWRLWHPATITDWVEIAGALAVGAIGGVFLAAAGTRRG